MNRSDNAARERQVITEFREGVKRAYGKKFWVWVDGLRGCATRAEFSKQHLKIHSAALSRGTEEGNVSLENIIVALIELKRSISELPALPTKDVLAMRGVRQALRYLGFSPSVEELCCMLVLLPAYEKWLVIRNHAEQASTKALRIRLATTAATWHAYFEKAANALIYEYFGEYPDEVEIIPIRTRDMKEYDRFWDHWGGAFVECNRYLYDYRWLDDANEPPK